MRLTNYMRDAFVSAAMQDVPHTDYDVEAEALARAEIKGMFAEVFPNANYDDETVQSWLDKTGVCMPGGLGNLYTYAPHYECLQNREVWTTLEQLAQQYKDQSESRHKLEAKLRAVARSCNTRKQLVDALPEMEKYLPEDEPAAMRTRPVVTNVIADFINAGWPKP